MERYRDTLIVIAGAAVMGAVMLVIVGTAETFKAGIAVGGTLWATGLLLGLSALPVRRRRS